MASWELKRDQILVLVSKEFKLKYNSTALGFFWSLLIPFFSSIIYYFVFGIIMRFNVPNYLLYLISGTFLWQFFANVITMSGHILRNNSSLLKKTSFDRRLLIWGTFATECIHLALTVPTLLIVMLVYGVTPDWLTVLPNLFYCLMLLTFFTMGLAYAYAAANIYFRDLERIIGIILQMWMFMTPIFIPVSKVPEKYLWVYQINPMAGIVGIWRDIFYMPSCHISSNWHLFIVALAVFFAGRWIFKRCQSRFSEMM